MPKNFLQKYTKYLATLWITSKTVTVCSNILGNCRKIWATFYWTFGYTDVNSAIRIRKGPYTRHIKSCRIIFNSTNRAQWIIYGWLRIAKLNVVKLKQSFETRTRQQQGKNGSWALWPDLGKFLHFGKIFKVFGNVWGLNIWQNVQHTFSIWPYCIIANGQIFKNLFFWSHWSWVQVQIRKRQ